MACEGRFWTKLLKVTLIFDPDRLGAVVNTRIANTTLSSQATKHHGALSVKVTAGE
jgi:hypothetical protein